MPVIIDELITEVLPDHPGAEGAEALPSATPVAEVATQLALVREREARLAVD